LKGVKNLVEAKQKISQLLEREPFLTTRDLSEKLGISRNTVAKYLEVMRAEGKVGYKEAGPAKAWFNNLRR
jgi:Mn-dependent DtxR family transcriptional regulator